MRAAGRCVRLGTLQCLSWGWGVSGAGLCLAVLLWEQRRCAAVLCPPSCTALGAPAVLCTALEQRALTSGHQYTLRTSDPVVNPGDFPECSEVFWFLCAEDTALGKQTLKKYNL